MANAYKYADGLNDSYDLGCEMERKRVECAIIDKGCNGRRKLRKGLGHEEE